MKLIYHPVMLEHHGDSEYPERPGRLDILLQHEPWITEGVTRLAQGLPEQRVILAENGEQYLNSFHTTEYIQRVKDRCTVLKENQTSRGDEVCFSPKTYDAACYAVGASVQAATLARAGQKSFALVRPPGHHATPSQASGYCIFNNVAIATEHIRQRGERVLIIDTDLHLGDGTLDYIQGKEQEVFYFSINQQDIWPNIIPPERENTENIFLRAGADDSKYRQVLEQRLEPRIKQFNPSIIAVSAGFDMHRMDALHFQEDIDGGLALTKKSYEALHDILDETKIPYFAILEGGYHPVSVWEGVRSFVSK